MPDREPLSSLTYDCPECDYIASFGPNTVGHYDALDHILAHANSAIGRRQPDAAGAPSATTDDDAQYPPSTPGGEGHA